MSIRHNDIAHGFHVFRDGAAWCAVGPHFQSIMDSDCGFGDTPEEAVAALGKELDSQEWWRNKSLPTIDKFTIHRGQ